MVGFTAISNRDIRTYEKYSAYVALQISHKNVNIVDQCLPGRRSGVLQDTLHRLMA